MNDGATRGGGRVRSIFVSDVHLGSKYSHAEALLSFLHDHEPDYVYLVGDIIDGWRLKRSWHWRPVYNEILHRLFELARQGTQVCYAPGNHDAFLRHFLHDFGLLEVQDRFIHRAADGRRFLVLHGDQFDNVELRAQWLSVLGSLAYETLMWVDRLINRTRRRLRLDAWAFSAGVKSRFKQAVRFISRFEQRLIEQARREDCAGVICGHIHTPTISAQDGVTYCNTGDWVENCSALVEYLDGSLEILRFVPSLQRIARENPYPDLAAAEELAVPTCTAA